MTERTRVLLVDDHEMARRGLEAMLSTAAWIEVVGSVDGCEPALAALKPLRPDVILLDIRMPGTDGLACLDLIRARSASFAVVIVTLYDDRQYVLEALRRGAAGYVLKDASSDEVIAILAAVTEGQLAVDPELLRAALTIRDAPPPPSTARERGRAHNLTNRELDVLAQVAEGLTNKEIGAHLGISEDTVKKHVQNLIWKLRAADRTQAAILALRMGLLEDG